MEHKSSEVPLHESGMVTVHIRDFDGYPWSVNSDVKKFLQFFVGKEYNSESEKEDDRRKYSKMQELVKELYHAALKDDPKWHFFYEPEIIVRISSKEVLQKVEELLTKKGAKFDVYPYPIPDKQKQKQYGETEGGIVLAYFDLFVSIFHTHAVAGSEFIGRVTQCLISCDHE